MALHPTWLYTVLAYESDYEIHTVTQEYAGVSEELALGLVWTKLVEHTERQAEPGVWTDFYVVRYRIQGLVVDVHHREWNYQWKTWDVSKNAYVGPSYAEKPEVPEEGHGRIGWHKGFPDL